MKSCSRPNSGTVSRMHFELGTGIDHKSGITWHDYKVKGSNLLYFAIFTQYWMVISTSYLGGNIMDNP